MFDPIINLEPESAPLAVIKLFSIEHSEGVIRQESLAMRQNKCPYCGALWLFSGDDVCHTCFKSVGHKGLKKTPIDEDFIL